jgi:hypothetical protein
MVGNGVVWRATEDDDAISMTAAIRFTNSETHETEFCIRAQAKLRGGRFVYVPEAKIEHKVPAARLTWGYYRSRCMAEGLSKAYLSTLTATGSLSTEREYVRNASVGGFFREIGSLRISGLKRAAAMAYGLGSTGYGFMLGKIRHSRRTHLSETPICAD